MPLRILLLFFICCVLGTMLNAQKMLLIERYGKANPKKIYVGETIRYKLEDDDQWYIGVMQDIILEQNLIVLGDRYVAIDKIVKIRYTRNWAKRIGPMFFWFGSGWSVFAAIGTATDGDSSTNYRWSDAIVTGASWLVAWTIPKIFKYKTYTLGKRRKLRPIDISIIPTKEEPAKAIPIP